MQYKIQWTENKSNDWKIVSIEGLDGVKLPDVSVNRVNKKGEVFPNFDGITPGATIEADLWTSSTGKHYLFAPKSPAKKSFTGNAGITKAMETKAQNIEKSQDRKEESISKAGAQRDAVLIVTTFYKDITLTPEEIKSNIEEWYKYFLNLGDQPFV